MPEQDFLARPYRPCVGVALFDRRGLVFVGHRDGGVEHTDDRHVWQMPQGGIDPGEAPERAAARELYEETNIRSVSLLGQSAEWLCYDLPEAVAGLAWQGRYRGQSQKWFAFRFDGEETEIDVLRPGGGRFEPEFRDWRWERLERVPSLIIPFKRPVYERVAAEFARFAAPAAD